MLRAEVPPDKERITFNSLEECDDMWTHLFCQLCEDLVIPEAEIWHYNGGPREVQYTERVIERWIPNIQNEFFLVKPEFDFIWARGGFQEYVPIILGSKAFKMYYGAGRRFYPIPEKIYNLVLVDSKEQKREIKKALPNQNVSLFIKPAADNIFKPVKTKNKVYDVCVAFQLASYTKRFDLAIKSIAEGGFSALVIGHVPINIQKYVKQKYPKIAFAGRHQRKLLPELYSDCKVGLAVHSPLESCPRVIPEFLACDLPIVVTNDTLFWKEKYIDWMHSGILVNPEPEYIAKAIQLVLDEYDKFEPREFYERNLTVKYASMYLRDVIMRIL